MRHLSGQAKFVKFLMSILKWQFNSSLNFVSTLRLMKGNYTLQFISDNICFYQKEIIKVKIFETFECSGQDLSNSLRQFWNEKSIPLQILYPPSVSWRKTSLYFFSSNNIYFPQNELIKIPIFSLSSALVKISDILHSIFPTTRQLKVVLDKSVSNVLGETM